MTDQDKARRSGPNPNAVVYHDSSDTNETASNPQVSRPANDASLKIVLAKWIERLALDPSINLYAFRVAQRLCSKVRSESYRVIIPKCRSTADSAVLTLLVECGYVVQTEEAIAGKSAFRLVLEARQ